MNDSKARRAGAAGRLARGLAMIAALAVALFGQSLIGPAAAAPDSRPDLDIVFLDRTDPVKVVENLIAAGDAAAANFEQLEARRKASNSWLYPQTDEASRRRLQLQMRRAVESLDLSGVPDWSRQTVGVETVLMLREIAARAGFDPRTSLYAVKDGTWAVRGANLQLARIGSGVRAGDVVFTADTVANVRTINQEMQDIAPINGFDAYAYFTETPGGLFPPWWSGVVLRLPSFFRASIDSNTVWQLMLFLTGVLALVAVPVAVSAIMRGRRGRYFWTAAATMAVSLACEKIVIVEGSLTGGAGVVAAMIFSFALYLSLAMLAFLIVEAASDSLIERGYTGSRKISQSVARFFSRIAGVASFVSVIVYGLSTVGVPVVGIVAGLGVGGLAVALAAKTTLENFLASIVLYIDASIAPGDRIDSKEASGVVEDIGMRSTRVRNDDGHLTIITNAKFADLTITNLSRGTAAGAK